MTDEEKNETIDADAKTILEVNDSEGGFAFDSGERMGIVQEFWLFLKENKAYWIAPVIVVLLLLVVFVIAGSTAAAPFIYALF